MLSAITSFLDQDPAALVRANNAKLRSLCVHHSMRSIDAYSLSLFWHTLYFDSSHRRVLPFKSLTSQDSRWPLKYFMSTNLY